MIVNTYKLHGCIKCGSRNNLEFHHVKPENKKDEVSNMVLKSTVDTLIKEINECVVLCMNCHKKVHECC